MVIEVYLVGIIILLHVVFHADWWRDFSHPTLIDKRLNIEYCIERREIKSCGTRE